MDEEKNLIDRFEQFFQINYEEEILRKASVDEEFLLIEFSELSMFDLMLAEELLENPEETIKAAQYALERFDTSGSNKLTPRFANLPASTHLPIREARSKHLDRLHEFKGIVKQKNDVRPQLIAATFQCPRCQTKQVLQQNEKKLKTPRKCGECGWKGSFNLIKKNLQDVQKMVLEEAPEELTGGEQPKRINVFLKDDLVSPISDKKTNPGSKIAVSGILKEVPVNLSTGAKSTQFDLIIEGNYVKPVQEQFSELDIDTEERDELIQASKDPKVWDKLVESIAPSIYGHDKIKEALTLQLFGGCRKSQADGVNRRGDIHILLIGDPGAGKCVSGDTVITLQNGETTEISTLAKHHDVIDSKQISPTGTPSLGLNGKMNSSDSIRIWRREPEKQLFKIKTGTGKTLKVSQDHPLFTTQDGVIFAKEAQTLSEEDRIAIPRKIECTGETQFLEPQKEKYCRNSREYSFPSQITPTFSSFLGFLVSDGYITETDSSAWISFSKGNSALLQKYTKQFKKLFGETPTQRKTKGNHEIYVLSKNIYSFLKQNVEEVVGTNKTKRVPQKIKKSPKPCIKEFLQSLFDCDAHVNKKSNHIEYTTVSKDLAKDIENLLLRFGIITRTKTKTKHATNTTKKKKVNAHELIIPSDFINTYYTKIGFSNTDKAKKLHEVYNKNSNSKTNTDTIPGLQFFLKQIRSELGLTQKNMGIPKPSYAHYEQGNREPSRKTVQKICATLSKYDSKNVEILSSLAHSDVFWDKIVEIDTVQAKGYLYDLEVADTHNYVANGVVVHNSQLLKRMSHVAPKSRFVSGKGASGAGLCVAPHTKLYLDNGERVTAKEFVEQNMSNPKKVREGVWKQKYEGEKSIHGLNKDWQAHVRKPEFIWKLKAPKKIYDVKLQDGRQIEITGNTQLLTTQDATFEWIKAKNLTEEHYIAIPNNTNILNTTSSSVPYLTDIIHANPTIHGVEEDVSKIKQELSEKYGSIRKAASKLNINENNLYHSWVKPNKRGTISLKDFRKIAENVNYDWKQKVSQISLYNGKLFRLPQKPDEDFLYLLGLLLGDGDLRETQSKSYQIRLSNKTENLHRAFQEFLSEHDINFDVQQGSTSRPKATRTTNKILGQCLLSFGMQKSPKGDINLPPRLRRLPKDLLCHFLAGLYDADGCVHIRHDGSKGSDTIELYTTSKTLSEDVQSLLTRFNIFSRRRERPPKKGKISRKKTLHVLTIYGSTNIEQFKNNIPLRHTEKKKKLATHRVKKQNPNRNVIPNISRSFLKKINPRRVSKKASYNIGRKTLQTYISDENEDIESFIQSDVRWEKIKTVTQKEPGYDYVYDVTIPDSHNFVANNILVHNTASVVKDEFLKGWALEAGALVLANKGLACIDELDKMSQEDASAMHEALEQQSITISKANIQATLKSQTTVLAAANPKYGRFDPYEVLAKQIELSSTLINRFDLIFPIRDVPDKDKDNKLASFILNLHKDEKKKEVPFDTDFIKRYVAFAKQRVDPALSKAALREIRDYFIKMRNSSKSDDKIQSIPISARQLEGLVRLAEASAKTRFSSTVERRDAERAVDLLHHCLTQIGYDQETGEFDIDRITTGVTASQRSQISIIKEIITTLEEEIGTLIPIEDIVQEAEAQDIPEEKTDKIIMKLKQGGDIYSPKSGYISRI